MPLQWDSIVWNGLIVIYLVDTNIVLRVVVRTHVQHATVRTALRHLYNMGHELRITPQNCVEFWNVATRPVANNGFGLTTIQTRQLLRLVERLFPLLPDSPEIFPEWKRIVSSFNVSGVQVHDARLVAAMKVHGLVYILTLNASDFSRYSTYGIVAVNPTSM